MSDYSAIEDAETRYVLDSLFDGRPVSASDLRGRLSGVNRPLARRIAVDRLLTRSLSDREGPIILAILEVLGVGREKRRLTDIALDVKAEPQIRMWAAMSLAGEDPRMMDLLITELGPDGMAHLAENALVELITLQNPEQVVATVRRALEEWHSDLSPTRLLERIERCRKGLGLSCADVYAESLKSRKLAPHRTKMLEFFVSEASDDGIALLEEMRTQASHEDERRDLQAALLRLRSSQIDPHSQGQEPKGHAVVSNCDGHSGFIVLGIFENEDMTRSISELYIHADGEIDDGVVHARIRTKDFDTLVKHLQIDTNCAFVKTTLRDGAALVQSGLARTSRAKISDTRDIARAVSLFGPVLPQFSWGEGPCTQRSDNVSEEKVHTLLDRSEYEDTWLFDKNELESLGFPFGQENDSVPLWLTQNSAAIEKSKLKNRVVAMAEHMARWHIWNGEEEMSALCIALKEETSDNFVRSNLLNVMLQRSITWIERCSHCE